jgi:hypothetical protein
MFGRWQYDPPTQSARRRVPRTGQVILRTSLVWLLVAFVACWIVYHWGQDAGVLFAGLRCW